MFALKLTTCFLVLSIAGLYATAQEIKCVCNTRDGADAAPGSGAAGGAGEVGKDGSGPGCPGKFYASNNIYITQTVI